MTFLSKKYAGKIISVNMLKKEDLDLANHLVGLKQTYLKLVFPNTEDLMRVRREILGAFKKNKERHSERFVYERACSCLLPK